MNEEPIADQKRPSLIREALKSLSWINTWFDYRAFSKQRRRLLEDPKLALTAPSKTDVPWKSPLGFAVQGLVLTTVIIQVTASAFGLMLSRPKPYAERIRTSLQDVSQRSDKDLQTLRANLSIVEGADDKALFEGVSNNLKTPVRANYRGVLKADYVNALKDEIAKTDRTRARAQSQTKELARKIDLAKRADQVPAILFRNLLPLALVFAAYIFRILFERRRETQSIEKKHYSDVAYLYITTSHFFLMNVALSIATALTNNVFIYSGVYDRLMSESSDSLERTQLLFWEGQIVGPFLLCLPLIIISFRKTSAAIRTIFKLPPDTAGWIASYIRVSNFISFLVMSIVLAFFSLAYARIAARWERYRDSPQPETVTESLETLWCGAPQQVVGWTRR